MIFNLFKSKPSLKKLIPEGFVDIHSHILPGIDDGAKNNKESLELILEMKKAGFSKIIATPHVYPGLYNNTNDSIEKSYKEISNKLDKEIDVFYASEYMLDYSLIKKCKDKKILTIDDKHVLIEFNFIGLPKGYHEILFEIQTNGFYPILAHVERYRYLFNNKNQYLKLKNIGCKFQLNLLSTTGYYGKDIVRITDYLLDNKLFDFVGSDIHNIEHLSRFEDKVLIKNKKELKRIIDHTIEKFK